MLAKGMDDTTAGAREELPESLEASKAQASSHPSSSSSDSSPPMQRPYEYHSSSDSPPGDAQYREAYRTNGHGAQSSMSQTQRRLPPMQRFEGAQQSQYQQPMNGASIPHPHHPPTHPPNTYAQSHYPYHTGAGALQPAPMLGSVANGQNGIARFPLPPQVPLDGGRNKKDVKRRTKTGCLTCRKRRIKVCAIFRKCLVMVWVVSRNPA